MDLTGLYDGQTIAELGFFNYPENLTAVSSTTGGSLSVGTYQYVATYEWIDYSGNLHRSETSAPLTVVTSTTTSQAVVTIPYLHTTLKSASSNYVSNPLLVLYRTTANANPQIFYRVSAVNNFNNIAIASLAITDTASDATISTNSILYTQGNVYDNYCLDGASVICANQNQLFCNDPVNPEILHYSKLYNPGYGLAFASPFTINIPNTDGPITALART